MNQITTRYITENGACYEQYVITDPEAKTALTITPERGGMITSFTLDGEEFVWTRRPNFSEPASDYEFTCEYCDNKIRGKSTDEKGCSNCGASYKENLELLVREEEDRLEKRHYDEYMKLKDLEWEQNIRNERRDANIDEKYGTPIRFMEKNAKVIALVILLGLMMISVGITVLILKFR